MRLRPLALGALVSASACSGAYAQAASQFAAPEPGADREYRIGASVAGIYDSNIARSSAEVAAIRRIEREDYILTPAATASIVQPLGRQVIFLRGSGGYDFHRNNPSLDRQRYDVLAGYGAQFGICQPTAQAAYRAQQSDLEDVDQLLVENLQKTLQTQVGIACGRGVGPGGTLQAVRVETRNSANLREESDSTAKLLNAGVNYVHPTLGALTLVYGYQDVEFPHRIIPGRPVGDGFWTQTFGATVERDFGSRLHANLTFSRTTVKREYAPPGEEQKFTANTYEGEVTYRIGQRLEFALNGHRSVRPSDRLGKLYDIEQLGEILARYELGRRITVRAGYRITDVDSNQDTSIPTPVVTNSKTNSTYGAVTYRQSDRASLILDARYEDRETNLPQFDYKSTRVGLTAAVSF